MNPAFEILFSKSGVAASFECEHIKRERGIRRITEFLPPSGGWHPEERTGQSICWSAAVQEKKDLVAEHEQAHRRQCLLDHYSTWFSL